MLNDTNEIFHNYLRIIGTNNKKKIAKFSKKYINKLKIHSNLYAGYLQDNVNK